MKTQNDLQNRWPDDKDPSDWTPAEIDAYAQYVDDKLDAMSYAEREAALAAGDERARAKGYRVGDYAHVLQLTPAETTWIETRAALTAALKTRRKAANITQVDLARQLNTVPNRIVRAEANASNVSLDFIVRALVATGATKGDIAAALAT